MFARNFSKEKAEIALVEKLKLMVEEVGGERSEKLKLGNRGGEVRI